MLSNAYILVIIFLLAVVIGTATAIWGIIDDITDNRWEKEKERHK